MESEAETGLRRLRRLERVLMDVEAEGKAFYMGNWIGYMGNWIVELEELEEDGIEIVSSAGGAEKTCGTACCAGGYAALDPVLMAEGLHLAGRGSQVASDWMVVSDWIRVDSQEQFAALPPLIRVKEFSVCFGDKHGYGALAEFFGIAMEESHRIFAPEYYAPLLIRDIRVQDVLERVRDAMAMAEAPTGDERGLP
jgi:hypothetical protein